MTSERVSRVGMTTDSEMQPLPFIAPSKDDVPRGGSRPRNDLETFVLYSTSLFYAYNAECFARCPCFT